MQICLCIQWWEVGVRAFSQSYIKSTSLETLVITQRLLHSFQKQIRRYIIHMTLNYGIQSSLWYHMMLCSSPPPYLKVLGVPIPAVSPHTLHCLGAKGFRGH
jgi:hypothetical protein